MPLNHYLRNPWLNGSSTSKTYKGWSDVLAWSWGESIPVSLDGGSSQTGKTNIQPLNVTKYVDIATPFHGIWVTQGYRLNWMQLTQTQQTTIEPEIFRLKMYGVFVESQTTGAASGESRMTENISLVFERFIATSIEVDSNGNTIGERSWRWNQLTNEP